MFGWACKAPPQYLRDFEKKNPNTFTPLAYSCESEGILKESMDRDDEWLRHEFAPGEEPTVYTADLCAEVGHEHCEGIDRTVEGYEGEPVFCICRCHRVIEGDLN